MFTYEWSDRNIIFLDIEIILDRQEKKISTKIYVKPTNKQLFLNYRSCHPKHVFASIIYSQALRGLLLCSEREWTLDFLDVLREKFLLQEYPADLIICS